MLLDEEDAPLESGHLSTVNLFSYVRDEWSFGMCYPADIRKCGHDRMGTGIMSKCTESLPCDWLIKHKSKKFNRCSNEVASERTDIQVILINYIKLY